MRTVAVAIAGTLVLAGSVILGQQQQPSQPVFVAGPAEVVGSVSITNEPTVQAQQAGMWEVRLADPVALVIPTPEFLVWPVLHLHLAGQRHRSDLPGSLARRERLGEG